MTYEETESLRAPHEAAAREAVEAALLAQGRTAAAAIERGVPVLYALDSGTLPEVLADVWARTVVAFADGQLRELGPASKAWADWVDVVRGFVDRVGAAMVRRVTDTTRGLIRAIVEEGVAEGWSARRIADEVRERWPEVSAQRAETIARTEVLRASNYGQVEGARRASLDFGLDLRKVWVASPDHRTRRQPRDDYDHMALDGVAVPLDGVFSMPGPGGPVYLTRPGDEAAPPGATINCRCTLRFEPVRRAARSWREERDDAIREAYRALQPQKGAEVAYQLIGEEKGLQPDTVRKIVHRIGSYG